MQRYSRRNIRAAASTELRDPHCFLFAPGVAHQGAQQLSRGPRIKSSHLPHNSRPFRRAALPCKRRVFRTLSSWHSGQHQYVQGYHPRSCNRMGRARIHGRLQKLFGNNSQCPARSPGLRVTHESSAGRLPNHSEEICDTQPKYVSRNFREAATDTLSTLQIPSVSIIRHKFAA